MTLLLRIRKKSLVKEVNKLGRNRIQGQGLMNKSWEKLGFLRRNCLEGKSNKRKVK